MSDIDAINVPGYRMVSRIMAGGMATVYVAEQLKLGSRRVAIKIFRNRNPDQALADHTRARHKRFAQEALIARNLQHPHVVQIFDYGSTDDFQFLVMEYLAHGDLKQRLRASLTPPEALNIMRQIASALALLHGNGIVHRDIKPANILFREPDHAVLADFGIARSIDQNTQLTNTGFVLGTPSYMSPEQINGGRVSAKTDIYALGVVFYEMLTGYLPYRGDSVQSVATQHLMAPVPPLPLNVRRLQPLLNRLMAKKFEDRIASGSELLQALAQIDCSRSFAIAPPSFVQIHAKKMIAVAALLLGSVAVTWAGISQLPYWLDVATPLQASVGSDALIAPAADNLPVPVAAEPALQQVTAAGVDAPPRADVSPVAVEEKPQLVVTEPAIPAAASRLPRRAAEKTVLTTRITKKDASRKSPDTAEILPPSVATNIDADEKPAEPVIAQPGISEPVIAEQRAAYTAETTATLEAQSIKADSVQQASAPAGQPESQVPEQKKKLPPVISFF